MDIVKSTDKSNVDFMVSCKEGEPGYLVTRGGHVMSGYVNAKSDSVFYESTDSGMPWYLNLGDVGFWLLNPSNSRKDYYWQSRDNALLIRGGANYAYAQINVELKDFITSRFTIDPCKCMPFERTCFSLSIAMFDLAVVGLKVNSEHQDDCLVTIEVQSDQDRDTLEKSFLIEAQKKGAVIKGAKPTRVRFATIPKNFKGAILVKELKNAWEAELKTLGART